MDAVALDWTKKVGYEKQHASQMRRGGNKNGQSQEKRLKEKMIRKFALFYIP